jgi:hypothetical protein
MRGDVVDSYAQKFLESLHRFDLALLTSVCTAAIAKVDRGWEDFYGETTEEVVIFRAPVPVDVALKALPPPERKRIAEAVASGVTTDRAHEDIQIESTKANAEGAVALLADLIVQRETMISVATGGDRIQDVNDYYIAREAHIREAMPSGIHYENPYRPLALVSTLEG